MAVAVLGLGAGGLALVLVGADRLQHSLRRELQMAFAGTTKADVDRWTADGTMLQEVFAAVSVFADGTKFSPDEVEVKVRYPAPFFGLHRCVFVSWTPTVVEFKLGSGDARCVQPRLCNTIHRREMAIHAMPMRAHYRGLLPRPPETRR